MKRILLVVLLFGIAGTVNAQSVPAGWTITKDDSGTCQVAHPADWKPWDRNNTTADPKKLIEVSVTWEKDAKVEVLNSAAMKAMRVKVAIENTPQRTFAEHEAMNFGPGPERRLFTVLVPARPKGACNATLSLSPGSSEELLKRVAMTLAPAK
jgi:NADH:ubiquinone oxidoreductase subunit